MKNEDAELIHELAVEFRKLLAASQIPKKKRGKTHG